MSQNIVIGCGRWSCTCHSKYKACCQYNFNNSIILWQVYTGQQKIELNLANLLTLKDNQVRFIRSYHKTILLPSMVTLNTLLTDHASAVTALGVDIITKVRL